MGGPGRVAAGRGAQLRQAAAQLCIVLCRGKTPDVSAHRPPCLPPPAHAVPRGCRNSCYLFGRERRVADVPTDHPSCSKQHAVLQYRLTEKEGADGMMAAAVRPYVMDLGATNGTFLNGERLEAQRYYELLEKDMLRFGNSSREYVLLKEV